MPPRPHILVVNGRKVRHPVFIIGAPYSGADLLARALKQSPGFHVTIGQQSVLSVVYAFARSPSIQRGRGEAAATVLRDAFAQAWQVSAHSCLACSAACRETGRVDGAATCLQERDIGRYGDATPDLMYCAESVVDAFPDARIVQVIRDGRDVVAAMLGDAQMLGFLKRGTANVESEFPNPFFGIETDQDLAAWPGLSPAGKCAMRWRGSVHKMARLRTSLDAEQLTTLRYEQMIKHPGAATAAVSQFIGASMNQISLRDRDRLAGPPAGPPAIEPGGWRRLLSAAQLAEIEKVAGQELRRVGYGA
ncbi:MAG TPA: sulfotransferase [Streptosporangiaceae bacterium]|nr:sulfotransferase [Streptosporangiaceae bacterium]